MLNKRFEFSENTLLYHYIGGSSEEKILKKNIFLWRNQNTLQMLIKNYSTLTLLIILPIYLFLQTIEMFCFLIILKIDIASTYPQGLIFNLKMFPKTILKRRQIQKNRIINEIEILKRLYWGNGKIRQLSMLLLDILKK